MKGLRAAGRGLVFALAVAAMIAGGFGVVGSVVYGAVDYLADHNNSSNEALAERPEAIRTVIEIGMNEKAK